MCVKAIFIIMRENSKKPDDGHFYDTPGRPTASSPLLCLRLITIYKTEITKLHQIGRNMLKVVTRLEWRKSSPLYSFKIDKIHL